MRLPVKVVLELQSEVRRSAESRYDHRLHGILLVATGMTYADAANHLRESPRTIKYWVRDNGLAGLRDETRPGRPPRLTDAQINEISALLKHPPEHSGLPGGQWSGRMLVAWVERQYGIKLGVRQCERLLKELREG